MQALGLNRRALFRIQAFPAEVRLSLDCNRTFEFGDRPNRPDRALSRCRIDTVSLSAETSAEIHTGWIN